MFAGVLHLPLKITDQKITGPDNYGKLPVISTFIPFCVSKFIPFYISELIPFCIPKFSPISQIYLLQNSRNLGFFFVFRCNGGHHYTHPARSVSWLKMV